MLVHGFGASSGHWRKNVPFLAQKHTVFAIDLLGFGRSDKPLIPYSIDLWRDLVLDFVAEFAQQPAILVGNSIGSLTCLAANAADTAGRISGCVLINCAGGMNNKARGPPEVPCLLFHTWALYAWTCCLHMRAGYLLGMLS